MNITVCILGAALWLIACVPPRAVAPSAASAQYMPSTLCKGCHGKIYNQHIQSHHEGSFLNPAVQAQYFQEVLPLAEKDPAMVKVAEGCIACHAPQHYALFKEHIVSRDQIDSGMPGITCDLCHTITGYAGDEPGNGNYLSTPSERKLGPYKHKSDWHHVYSKLQTKSEFCAICHNATNQHGLAIKETYTEWKTSRFAKERIQCQDCHMSLQGFLTDGRTVFESGRAADMTLGQAPVRKKLHTHRFPGAHSKTQIAECVSVLRIEAAESVAPGETTPIRVIIDNTRSGHKMPSGSAELRLLWLEVTARIGDEVVSIPAETRSTGDPYDVSGAAALDREIVRTDIPKGSRIYRTILAEGNGSPTLSSYKAVKVLFDNRLNASEIREERYSIRIPSSSKGPVVLTARLNYQAYSSSFTDRFGLEKAEPFEVSSVSSVIAVK